jgi:hypothetical protein
LAFQQLAIGQHSNLTTGQIAAISGEQFGRLTSEQFINLLTTQIRAISTSAVQSITPAQFRTGLLAFSDNDVAALVADSQISAIVTKGISELTTSQVVALLSSQFEALGTAQVAALTTEAAIAIGTGDIIGLQNIAALSTSAIEALTTAQAERMTAIQVEALKTAQFEALTTRQLGVLVSSQVQAISTANAALYFYKKKGNWEGVSSGGRQLRKTVLFQLQGVKPGHVGVLAALKHTHRDLDRYGPGQDRPACAILQQRAGDRIAAVVIKRGPDPFAVALQRHKITFRAIDVRIADDSKANWPINRHPYVKQACRLDRCTAALRLLPAARENFINA